MAKKEAKTNKKENNKNKKSFSKDFKAELKKVVWPTPKQLVNNTVAVIAIVLVTAAIVFVLDLTFETLNKHGVNKIKEVVSANNTVTADNTTSNQTTENTNNETSTEDSSVTIIFINTYPGKTFFKFVFLFPSLISICSSIGTIISKKKSSNSLFFIVFSRSVLTLFSKHRKHRQQRRRKCTINKIKGGLKNNVSKRLRYGS